MSVPDSTWELQRAVREGSVDGVQAALSLGADVNRKYEGTYDVSESNTVQTIIPLTASLYTVLSASSCLHKPSIDCHTVSALRVMGHLSTALLIHVEVLPPFHRPMLSSIHFACDSSVGHLCIWLVKTTARLLLRCW